MYFSIVDSLFLSGYWTFWSSSSLTTSTVHTSSAFQSLTIRKKSFFILFHFNSVSNKTWDEKANGVTKLIYLIDFHSFPPPWLLLTICMGSSAAKRGGRGEGAVAKCSVKEISKLHNHAPPERTLQVRFEAHYWESVGKARTVAAHTIFSIPGWERQSWGLSMWHLPT